MANSLASGQKPTGVADLDSSQTLENKTLDSTSTVNGSDVIAASIQSPVRADVKKDTLANLQTYALTASNGQLCFATDAKKMYQVLDAALAEVGSGQGGINYISNPDFELNADGWSSDSNLTIARSTSAPLRGDASGLISKAAVDASGEVVKIPFTIESADLAKKLYISFDKDASDANYADADLRVEIIKDPNGTPVTIRCNAEDILGGKGSHLAWFQSDADILEYELVFKCNSANASAYVVKIDNVQVGPRGVSYGSAITDWKPYTPTTAGMGTTSSYEFQYRRVGSNLEVIGKLTSGTSTASEMQVSLPDNLIIDIDQSGTQIVGFYGKNGVSDRSSFVVLATNGDSFVNFGLSNSSNASLTVQNGNNVIASGQILSVEFSVPIKGWSSNSIQSEDIGNREVRVRAEGNGAGSVTANVTPVDFTQAEDTTGSWDGSTFTAPETGDYLIVGKTNVTAASTYYPKLWLDTGSGYVEKRAFGDTSISGVSKNFQTVIRLNKGDKFQIRLTNTLTLSNSNSFHNIHIQKLAQPQTLLETETVAARYTSNSGAGITTTFSDFTFEEKDYDTHNMYSAGILTIPVTGFYHVSAKILVSGGSQDARIQLVKNTSTVVTTGVVRSTTANNALQPSISETLYFQKGETIKFQIYNSLNTNLEVFANFNSFSIARIK